MAGDGGPGPGGVHLPDVLAVQESALAEELSLVEVFTVEGAIPCLRHGGPGDGEAGVVLYLGGALGGLSGPAAGHYGRVAALTGGIRLHYRFPGELGACVADAVLVADLLLRRGADRVVLVGHSFGGAVAVGAGVALGDRCAGVVTLATQAPGCERVDELTAPLLLIHGDDDSILPWLSSQLVAGLAGGPTELVILPGEGHLLSGAADLLDERVGTFVLTALGHDEESRRDAAGEHGGGGDEDRRDDGGRAGGGS